MAGTKARQYGGLYSRWASPRLWRRLAVAGVLALTVGGCSLSGQFDSLFGSERSDQTGTITPPPGTREVGQLPPDADLAYARAAASAVLSRDEKDASIPWENPGTGTRGTVTPIASAYTQDGRTCRDFLASFVSRSSQAWVQGEACKQQQGEWEVRSLKPWKRS
ncbi:MAG TPA: RT0821/Lpp0805 family surface protein [Pseudolabrys sp.]|nr:RT0821/Lpp0805 family surface protein [Pseudolabrys sp.]